MNTKINFSFQQILFILCFKAKLNELVPDENDRISTPDIVLTAQLSQGINNKKTPNVRTSNKKNLSLKL